jgi:MoaD family protein
MKIRYFAILRNITGVSEEIWNQPVETLQDLIQGLCKKYDREFQRWVGRDENCFGSLAIILINGVDSRSLQDMQTPLKTEDTVYFFPPMAGGSGAVQFSG